MSSIELLEKILDKPENLYGLDVNLIRKEFKAKGLSRGAMQEAKRSLKVITLSIPASEDGVRQEKWLWMRR